MFYHEVDKDIENCILKAKVTPSQSVNNKAYDVWLVMKKDNGNIPGEQIVLG